MLIPILILWEWDGVTPIPRVATDLVSRLAYFGFRPPQATTGHHRPLIALSLSRSLRSRAGRAAIIIHPYLISWCEVLESELFWFLILLKNLQIFL